MPVPPLLLHARPGLRRRALSDVRALHMLGAAAASAALAAGCSAPAPPPAGPPAPETSAAPRPSRAPADGSAAPGAATPAPEQAGPPGSAEGSGSAGGPDEARVRELLASLPVKGRAPKTGYSRDAFGQAWSDDVSVDGGHNGCDTRNDILRRDLTGITVKPGTHGCTVLSGVLEDPYTGMRIDFTRGRGTSREVQIDHVVALISDRQLLGSRI